MTTDIYQKLRKAIWITWIIFIVLLLLFIYVNQYLKSIPVSIFLSILTLLVFIGLIKISRIKENLRAELGLIKKFGKRNNFNSLAIMNISLGLIYIIIAIFSNSNTLLLILKLTVGLGWILIGFGNKLTYYLMINDKYIIKLRTEFIKLDKIDRFELKDNTLTVGYKNKIIEIYYNEITNDEMEELQSEIEKIRKKNNLA